MTKQLALAAFLALNNAFALAQVTWHQKLPANSGGIVLPYCQLSFENGAYLVNSTNSVYVLSATGRITGRIEKSGSPSNIWATSLKRVNAATGLPYFLQVRRTVNGLTGYTLVENSPGFGDFQAVTFADSLGAAGFFRPKLLNISENEFVVFGRQFVRRINYAPATGFSEAWVKPLSKPMTDVILLGNQFVMADETNGLHGLDLDGNLLWSKELPYTLRTLRATGDGFIACARNTTTAVILKLDADGDVVWEKTTADKDYYEALPAPGGGFVAVGSSPGGTPKIVLTKFGAAGDALWRREYSDGNGASLLATADGGWAVLGRSANAAVFIKTDADGNAPDLENPLFRGVELETANLTTQLFPSPNVFTAPNGAATFESKADSASSIYTVAPWMGGWAENGDLHLSVHTFPANNTDYKVGLSGGAAEDFNRAWKISRLEINALRRDFKTDNTLDQLVPFDLLTWPAKGNPHLKQNLDFSPLTTNPDLFPAPFVDANGDGVYNVYDGDYPKIKGDEMAWFVLNDNTPHATPMGLPLNVDLFVSAYRYDCQPEGLLSDAIFLDFEMVNRSDNDYSEVYFGLYNDFDLGCYADDYVGSMPDVDTYYVYNTDDFDMNCADGVQGFEFEIPVQTGTFLNHPMSRAAHSATTNDGLFPAFADNALEFYNILTGKWADGTPLTIGGVGYNPGSTALADHAFPDNPAGFSGWSMCSENLAIADRRMSPSHGPFDFVAGDTFLLRTVYAFHPNIQHPCPDVFSSVKSNVAQVQSWHDDGTLDARADLGQVVNLPNGQSIALNASTLGATYAWSTGATTASINVTTSGIYSVEVTHATGCRITEEVFVQQELATQQPLNVPVWNLQPNPAKDALHIACAECAGEDLRVVVRNAQGVAVGTSAGLRLDVARHAAGFYWVELWQGMAFLGSRKLIKMEN